ncbi:hypothetical protein [Agromyces sp. SYSU T00194]|uniref:hypothetical protein n=1 Tax=Agromyces chitinivorans TaxID=3158560 RepID=UPI00339A5FD0
MSDAPADDATPADVSPEASAAPDGLAERLAGIDELPLEERAAAFEQLHRELRAQLEGADPEAAD